MRWKFLNGPCEHCQTGEDEREPPRRERIVARVDEQGRTIFVPPAVEVLECGVCGGTKRVGGAVKVACPACCRKEKIR